MQTSEGSTSDECFWRIVDTESAWLNNVLNPQTYDNNDSELDSEYIPGADFEGLSLASQQNSLKKPITLNNCLKMFNKVEPTKLSAKPFTIQLNMKDLNLQKDPSTDHIS